ncbi:MAG: LPXTG cell wall anchor domain-containing protein [Bacteroidales bacterium]|nr:LPXTG cell wall anchor domain-containing protein [Bacteroidales bacterium]
MTAQTGKEQMFLFTFAGIVLAVTGLIVKNQYK